MKPGLVAVLVAVCLCSCTPDPYPHVPATATACEGACIVLATFDCPEARKAEPGKCEANCEQIARLGYAWNTDASGPVCIRSATTLDAVRACNVKCEGR